jgi:hypothetical protein
MHHLAAVPGWAVAAFKLPRAVNILRHPPKFKRLMTKRLLSPGMPFVGKLSPLNQSQTENTRRKSSFRMAL